MNDGHEELKVWEKQLALAESDLAERERTALAGGAPPSVFAAFAAERDKLATDRSSISDLYDDQAARRDRAGLTRDVSASGRDRHARGLAADRDPAYADRSLAGVDRDDAAGDRGDSYDDRRRGRASRDRAAADRQHAGEDRERATEQSDGHAREVAGLRTALESRMVIGQATGLLMARHNMNPEDAFKTLVHLSQHYNIKMRDLAAKLVAFADEAAR